MKSICLFFQVHQPIRLKKFRFFEIGNSDYYYDDHNNKMIIRRLADNCYLPTNKIILELIHKFNGRFRVAFSISGTAIDQFKIYAPEVIDSFRELAATGCVEFLAETYTNSLVFLKNRDKFKKQVEAHAITIESLFGVRPRVFKNTGLIYSDEIGAMIAELGFDGTLAEGPNHLLRWRSPNYVYCNAIHPSLRILLKNQRLSDDITYRFSNPDWSGWPMNARKYVSWINKIPKEEKIVNLFIDYETFGEHQKSDTGIFKFLKALPSAVFAKSGIEFLTPSQVIAQHKPISTLHVPYPVSAVDEEGDLNAWLGNDLQQDAFDKLYALSEKIDQYTDTDLLNDWQYLQTSDHFYYMSTKYFTDGGECSSFNPYNSPYDAFVNYMNILNDFTLRLNRNIEINHFNLVELKQKVFSRFNSNSGYISENKS